MPTSPVSDKTQQNDRAPWLHGPDCECSVKPPVLGQPWRLILLGAPGVGKGTQAQLLTKQLRACHLSTGDVFRAAKGSTRPLTGAMAAAVTCMNAGQLVPDETVLDMIRERRSCLRCTGGFILDGFPRTVPQAEALEAMLGAEKIALDGVLDFVMPIEQIVARLSGRRTCGKCKAVYHVTGRPPKTEGVCDACGSALIIRDDDRPEAIRIRMQAYEAMTAPLTAYYRARGLVISVEASGTPEEISARAIKLLQDRRKK